MADIKLEHIYKTYDKNGTAVTDFNLEIKDKEFIVFVGPSGCGKSTTLRMIAGLEDISQGELFIDGKRMNDISPKDRNIAMVFQNYALYPHMTVYDNIAFGLKMKKTPKYIIEKKVREAAAILDLEPYLKRKPKALSGGQRQRVALGRAIVRDAKVFLMDEPLSNLDAKLRVHMRAEIIKLHQKLQTTTIYVTHDQTEAMTMASRLVVMKDGIIQQIGSPQEVYNFPENVFVGSFIGSPAMNFLTGTITNKGVSIADQFIQLQPSQLELLQQTTQPYVKLGIRPEHLYVAPQQTSTSLQTTVDVIELLGAEKVVYCTLNGQTIIVRIKPDVDLQIGHQIHLQLDLTKVHFFDIENEKRLSIKQPSIHPSEVQYDLSSTANSL